VAVAGTIFGVNRVKDPRISWVKIEIEGRHPIRGLPELDPYPQIIMAMEKNPWVAKAKKILGWPRVIKYPTT
jgi:hypothetical protein